LPFGDHRLRSARPLDREYPTELRTIGDHIRKRRLDLGLLQREVALRIGVDKTTVYNWEAGRATPSLRGLPAVIWFLGYDPADPEATPEERTRPLGKSRAAFDSTCPASQGPSPTLR
jgi:DNA-binding XRE family transcriptional regulator